MTVLLLPWSAGAQAPSGGSAAVGGTSDVLPSRSFTGACFTEIHLADLPGSRTLWSLIETADALTIVDRIENGGLYLGESKLAGNIGSSWTQAGFTTDGLDLTSPAQAGTPLSHTDSQALGSVSVTGALPPVDLAGAGPTVSIAPRAPAARWGAGLQASFLPNSLQALGGQGQVPAIAEFDSAGEGSAFLSGPLSSQGSGLFLSARRAVSTRFERGDLTVPLDDRLTSIFAHAVVPSGPNARLRIVAGADATAHPFAGRARFPDPGVSASDRFWNVRTVWEQATPGGATWSAAFGYARGGHVAPDGAGGTVVGVIERLRDGPVPSTTIASSGVEQRLNGVVRVRPNLGRSAGSWQTLDIGLSVNRTSASSDPMPRAVIGELTDGLPARAWDYSWGETGSLRRATEIAAWANDQIALWPRVTLDAGVRFEATRAAARGNETAINWQTVLPRGLLRLDVTGSGSLAAYVGGGLYRHRLPLDHLAWGDESAPAARVYRWTDPNGDGKVQPGEMQTLVALAGPGRRSDYASAIDPDLAPPLTGEFTVGFEASLGKKWRARLFGVQRHARRLIAPVNVGVTLADYTARELPDPGHAFDNPADDRLLTVYDRNPSSFGRDRALLTNPEGHNGKQVALDLAFERLFDGRWYMLFGATAQRSDGLAGNPGFKVTENDTGVLGALYLDPNAFTYSRGRGFFERGYIIKWSGGFVTPGDFHFGAIARYQDGQHFARMALVPGLNQGPELVQAYTRGHSRFTFTFTADARVSQGFRVGNQRVSLVAEAFNLFNSDLQVEEDPVVTRSYRATTAVQPPRTVRLGVRLDF